MESTLFEGSLFIRVDVYLALGALLTCVGPALVAFEFTEASLPTLIRGQTVVVWTGQRTALDEMSLLEAQAVQGDGVSGEVRSQAYSRPRVSRRNCTRLAIGSHVPSIKQ